MQQKYCKRTKSIKNEKLILKHHKIFIHANYIHRPPKARFGILGLICSVVPGLLIGAAISKNMASFLEENELFVPSDEDDDD